MAVSVNDSMRTIFDGSYTQRLNVSEFIDAIDPRDTPLLAMLGMGGMAESASAGADTLAFPATNPIHTWQNDTLIPAQGTLDANYTSGGGILTLASEEEHYLKVGDQVMVNDTHYVVTGLNGDDTIDVTVVQGSADANHVTGDRWYNLGSLRLDGENFSTTYLSTDLTSMSNHTQIFHDIISISGTSEAVEKFGITDEFDREFAKKFQEMVIRLEQAAHYGRRTGTFPVANSTRANVRRMGGLWHFIRNDANANTLDANGAELTEDMLVDILQEIWADGGRPDTILVGAAQKRRISKWALPFVRSARTDNTLGVIVGTYESEFGNVDIVLDRYVKPSDLIILTSEYIGIGALKGNGVDRSFFVQEVPPAGDSRQAAITGEYTMEVRNSTTAHGWIYDLDATL
jgi:hypothetical protein